MSEIFTINIKVEMVAPGKFNNRFSITGMDGITREQLLDGILSGMDSLTRLFHQKCVRLSYYNMDEKK